MTLKEEFKQFLEEKANKVTKKDFNSFLKSILEAIKKKEDAFTQRFNLLLQDLKDSTTEFRNIMKTCKEMVAGELKKFQEKHEKRMNEMMVKMDEMEAGKDEMKAEIALEAHRMTQEALLPQIPKIEQIEQDLPKLGDPIASALELLPEEKKLVIEAIKGLRKELDEIREIRSIGGRIGYSKLAVEQFFIDDETPSGTINGVNTTFTLAHAPSPASSLKVYRGGARQRVTEDYTLSNKTITFLTAPVVGEIICVDYHK